MFKHLSFITIVSLLLLLVSAPGAAGQYDDPVEAAIRYAIELESLSDYGERLLMVLPDARAERRPAVRDSLHGRLSRVAARIGARTGRFTDEVQCPPPNPTPEEFQTFGCRFRVAGRATITASSPERTDEGVDVWVTTWIDPRSRGRTYAHTMSRQVHVAFTDGVGWRAIGVGIISVP